MSRHRDDRHRLCLHLCSDPRLRGHRLTTGLTRAINAMNDKYTVRDEWMFALPLLHAVTDSTDPCGLGGIDVGDRRTSTSFEVICHDIAAIWVAFFLRCQRYRC